jgi:uncharacterized glyoxalase superfamily protein PhnB
MDRALESADRSSGAGATRHSTGRIGVHTISRMASVSRVIPIIVCEDIAATHDFLVAAFGFEPGEVQRDDDGRVVHGEVRGRDSVIWLHAVSPAQELASPRTSPQASGGIVAHVDDVDAHFAHARAAGAMIDSEPIDQEYGQREYGARDPEGHLWWFATPIDSP